MNNNINQYYNIWNTNFDIFNLFSIMLHIGFMSHEFINKIRQSRSFEEGASGPLTIASFIKMDLLNLRD